MWTYAQSAGEMQRDGEFICVGYSGFGAGKNNPDMESVANVGPIPRGRYQIGSPFDSETHGPVVMRLTPCDGTETFGRDGFLIHGDSVSRPGGASHGCIILPRPERLAIAGSGDTDLEVTL